MMLIDSTDSIVHKQLVQEICQKEFYMIKMYLLLICC